MGTESASTFHQTDGPAMLAGGGTKSYETAGEQYTNSKGFTKPVDESCNASTMKFLDEHGKQVSGMTSINMDKPPTNMTSDKNAVLPSVARKIARNAAVIGCLLMAPCLDYLANFKTGQTSWRLHAPPTQLCHKAWRTLDATSSVSTTSLAMTWATRKEPVF